MDSRDVQFYNCNNTESSWGLCLPLSLNTIPKSKLFLSGQKKGKWRKTIFKISLSILFSLLCFTAHISSLISLNFLHSCQVTFFKRKNVYLEHKANCFKCTQLLGNSAFTILSLLCHDKKFPPLISNSEILLT